LGVVVCAVAVAGLAYGPVPEAWACSANESPDILCSNEQQLVNALAAQGINATQSPHAAANLGWSICGGLQSGRSQDVEANRVYAYNTGVGGDGPRTVVSVAVADLCPQATARFAEVSEQIMAVNEAICEGRPSGRPHPGTAGRGSTARSGIPRLCLTTDEWLSGRDFGPYPRARCCDCIERRCRPGGRPPCRS